MCAYAFAIGAAVFIRAEVSFGVIAKHVATRQFLSSRGLRGVAFLALGRAEQSRNELCLFANLVGVFVARLAGKDTFEFVTVGDDDEHLVDQIVGEHAMGLIQSGPPSPLE